MAATKSLKVSGLVQTGKLVVAAAEKVAHMPQFANHSAQHALEAENERLAETNRELSLRLENVPQTSIRINALHEVEGRRRRLTPEQFAELVVNLTVNDLVTPITVRPRADGGFEIISGHNRVAAFRELKRSEIPARILSVDDRTALTGSFYANLLHPNLPDLEIYEGYKKILEINPQMTHEELAKGSGKSRQLVSQIMAYDEIPAELRDVLKKANVSLGSSVVRSIAALHARGRAPNLKEAIRKFASGEITQEQTLKFAAQGVSLSTKPRNEPIRFMRGKTKYCELRLTASTVRLDFKDEAEASLILEELREILSRRSKAK